MNPEKFTMWLHGFFEISGAEELTKTQVQIIKDHLNLCFDKQTPDRSKELPSIFTPGTGDFPYNPLHTKILC